MAECHMSLSQANLALSVLESVSPRARTARLNMLLGGLYQQTGMERPAITAYKEVLKVCLRHQLLYLSLMLLHV